MEVSQTFSQQTFFPLKSPSQCHYKLNFTHNCLIDCLFVFLSFCPDLSLIIHPARALRALGLLLADGAPTVGGGKTF